VTVEPFSAVDGGRGANLQLQDVIVDEGALLGEPGAALPLVERVIDESLLAMGGEALGAMQVLLDITVEYTRTREQALKVKLCEAGRFVSQQAVQLHGGIGMTDELAVGHHFKRLMLLARLYGDEAYYLQRYMELQKPVQTAA
jgi:alkylation response protein AidB-like acyl-CoA dehydrogenase